MVATAVTYFDGHALGSPRAWRVVEDAGASDAASLAFGVLVHAPGGDLISVATNE